MLVEMTDPAIGTVRLVGNPMKMSAFADLPTRAAAPDLDADRAAILRELGLQP
jgi:CoA:oxalate CoA-transferase